MKLTMNGIGKDLTGKFPGLCEGNNPQSDCRKKKELKVGKTSYNVPLLYILSHLPKSSGVLGC